MIFLFSLIFYSNFYHFIQFSQYLINLFYLDCYFLFACSFSENCLDNNRQIHQFSLYEKEPIYRQIIEDKIKVKKLNQSIDNLFFGKANPVCLKLIFALFDIFYSIWLFVFISLYNTSRDFYVWDRSFLRWCVGKNAWGECRFTNFYMWYYPTPGNLLDGSISFVCFVNVCRKLLYIIFSGKYLLGAGPIEWFVSDRLLACVNLTLTLCLKYYLPIS